MKELMRRVGIALTLPLVVSAPVVLLASPAHAVTTTTDMVLSASPSVYGQVVHATATVISEGQPVTQGAVQFSVQDPGGVFTPLGGPVPLNASGVAVSPPVTQQDGTPMDVTSGLDQYVIRADHLPTPPFEISSDTVNHSVDPAGSSLAILPSATTLVADLAGAFPGGMQAGSAPPSGTVHFFVGGQDLPAEVDPSTGRATLDYTLPPGQPQTVSATYPGDDRYTGTSGLTVRTDPTLDARVLPRFPKSKSGWYHSSVRIRFICRPAGSELADGCPNDVVLKRNGKHQAVTRTVRAVDGGVATITISGVNIDRDAPVIKVYGRHCTATDNLSGLKGMCKMTVSRNGHYVAVAKDKAGNRTVERGIRDTPTRRPADSP